MSANPLDALLGNPVSWLADKGPDEDIAISSRIRLARNLADLPFPINADEAKARQVMAAVGAAVNRLQVVDTPLEFEINALPALDRAFLLERRLVSKEFCEDGPGRMLVVGKREDTGVMVNEEDHLRVQAMCSGFALPELWDKISAMDDKLSSELPFAFDPELGYLTSCPTNVGTGMRASVMLHLPALALNGQINAAIQGVNKLGLTVRGLFGEGSDCTGHLYQISNQSTLGESEEQIVQRLCTIIRQIINHEKNAREKLLSTRREFLLDNIGRAYGLLRYAYTLSSNEAINSLSSLRLGVDMGMFAAVDISMVNELFVLTQPAHLQKHAKKQLESAERDALRAEVVRDKLKTSGHGG